MGLEQRSTHCDPRRHQYLIKALDKPALGIVDIGANVLPFRGMIDTFAEVRGLHRTIIPVPVLTPLLSGLRIGLITPIPNALAVPLIEGIIEPVLADTETAKREFPDIVPMPYAEAVTKALQKISQNATETRWADSLGDRKSYKLTDREGLIKEVRTVKTRVSPESVYRSFTSIGGDNGWLAWNWAWKIRGWFDSLIGGPGLSRGRRHPTDLAVGDALDFWRVEDLEPTEYLLLRAEMILPGKAWLQFEAIPEGQGTIFVQTAMYAPKGLIGFVYWYGLVPVHIFLFGRMANRIVQGAEAFAGDISQMPETV